MDENMNDESAESAQLPDQMPHGESKNVHDAVSLCICMLEDKDIGIIKQNLGNHIAEIASYDPKNPIIKELEKLLKTIDGVDEAIDKVIASS